MTRKEKVIQVFKDTVKVLEEKDPTPGTMTDIFGRCLKEGMWVYKGGHIMWIDPDKISVRFDNTFGWFVMVWVHEKFPSMIGTVTVGGFHYNRLWTVKENKEKLIEYNKDRLDVEYLSKKDKKTLDKYKTTL